MEVIYIRYSYEVEKIINLTSRRRPVTITACVFAPLSSSASSAGLSAGWPQVPASDGAELQVGNRGRHSKPGDGPFAFRRPDMVSGRVRRERGQRASRVPGRAGRIQRSRGAATVAGCRSAPVPDLRRGVRCGSPTTRSRLAWSRSRTRSAGSIHRNYDLLVERDLSIVGEVQLPVVHNLLALPGVALHDVKRVLSHPQALAQCAKFLRGLEHVEAHRHLRHRGQREDGARRAAAVDTAAIASGGVR